MFKISVDHEDNNRDLMEMTTNTEYINYPTYFRQMPHGHLNKQDELNHDPLFWGVCIS